MDSVAEGMRERVPLPTRGLGEDEVRRATQWLADRHREAARDE